MTSTTNLNMTLPTIGADLDNWGTELNANLGIIDTFATLPTRQVLTSGTNATYTTPANCRQLRIRMVGGGGGGGSYNNGSGGDGGDTIFNSIHAAGGKGGGGGISGSPIPGASGAG